MSDKSIFIGALEDVFESEMTEYLDALPVEEHPEYSRSYNKKMRKLISRRSKPYFKLISTAGRRAACVIVAVIIVVSVSVRGSIAAREKVFDFVITEYPEFDHYTEITVEIGSAKGYPKTIETEYYISALPKGFSKYTYGSFKDDSRIRERYDRDDGKYIQFSQQVKSGFGSGFSSAYTIEKISDEKGQEYILGTNGINYDLIWDNGEYIFTIGSNLDKDTVMELCKSTKPK